METVKLGIFGLGRGIGSFRAMLDCGGDIVAVCDKDERKLAEARTFIGNSLATYTDFDAFIKHDGLQGVYLANYFDEHTPFAIKALEHGVSVLSECTSNATMAEGVALVRAAEKSTAFYMLGENYQYMKFNLEMRRVYRSGKLGPCIFAEGEYNHPMEDFAKENEPGMKALRPYGRHWRNRIPATYYITHSLAPLMYITGAVPRRVVGMTMHLPDTEDTPFRNLTGDRVGVMMTQNDDGSIFRVTGWARFGAHENSYRICGTKGQIENLRAGESTDSRESQISLRYNDWQVPEGERVASVYPADWEGDRVLKWKINRSGHGGADYLMMKDFIECIRDGRRPEVDVYFATAMASVAILGHRSVLNGNVPYDVPDFHREEDRVKYENDHATPFYGRDGSKPTVNASSNPDYEATEERLDAYDEAMKKIPDQLHY